MPHLNPQQPNAGLERTRYQLRSDGVKTETSRRLVSGVHFRGYLPHVKREGARYFVTFRLADSLPKEVLLGFEQERAERLRRLAILCKNGETSQDTPERIARDFQRKVERYLDTGAGACPLRKPEIANMVQSSLLHFQDTRYVIHEWVVMPNHVHAIVWPMPNYVLSGILKSWKQFTSRTAKRMLRLKESDFWQKESYDHWIRNEEERDRVARYIRWNPVKAGLCARPEDWPWSSVVAQTSKSAVSPASKPASGS